MEPGGTRPVTSATNQATIAARPTASPQSVTQSIVRDREEEPEEDGEPAAPQVVGDDEADRVRPRRVERGDGLGHGSSPFRLRCR